MLILLGVVAPAAMFVTKVMRMDSRDRHVLDMRLKHHSSFWVKGNKLVEGVGQSVLNSVALDHPYQQIEVVAAVPTSYTAPSNEFISTDKHTDPFYCLAIEDGTKAAPKGTFSWGSKSGNTAATSSSAPIDEEERAHQAEEAALNKSRREDEAKAKYVLTRYGDGMSPSTNPTLWIRRNVVPAPLWFIDPKMPVKQQDRALEKLVKGRQDAERKRVENAERQSLLPV